MVVNRNASLKRVKRRRVTAYLYDFTNFPSGDDDVAASPTVPFRIRVRDFLSKHAILPPPSTLFPHLLTWQMGFRVGDSDEGLSVDVVEEEVARSSKGLYCDQCRVVGWSNNPVCTKRYHVIIKADGYSIGGYQKSCASCGEVLHMAEARCTSCNHVMTAEDVEDWMYHQLEDTTHLLHGVIHANGFGHLLRVNGREGGSKLLSGGQIMNFWDRLCKVLGARKISVMDVSKKYGLELRLLHAVIKDRSWYGNWGYGFGPGCFGLTHDAYKAAIDNLSSIPLDVFYSRGRTPRSRVHDLILFYQSLSESELVNIRDLFSFLLGLIQDTRKSDVKAGDGTSKKVFCVHSGVLSAWTSSDISRVEEAMFRVLRAVRGDQWVSWRTLKGAICRVGPPELLDYCLKELKGKLAADGLVFNARCNPGSGAIELRLEQGSNVQDVNMPLTGPGKYYPSEEHLVQDLRYLFGTMLHPQSTLCHVTSTKRDLAVSAASTLIDCKHFMKDYKPEEFLMLEKPHTVQLLCDVDAMEQPEDQVMNLPPEVLILPSDATIADVKRAAARAFQDVYVIFKRFIAEELIGFGGVDESTQVKLLVGSVGSVQVRGRCLSKNILSKFRMERGVEKWSVDCSCGAKDDDGERMLACDDCGVWQHTRCAGIPDQQAEPMRFKCGMCKYPGQLTEHPYPRMDVVAVPNLGFRMVANWHRKKLDFVNFFDCTSINFYV